MIPTSTTLEDIIGLFGDLIGVITPIVVSLALLYFFWGLAEYIRKSDSEEVKSEGKTRMLWGVIAIAVMVSIFGIITLMSSTLGFTPGGAVEPPFIDTFDIVAPIP
jgi:ribose/xylose/arabinose/galactoside ABC-type transport system permease subunit